MKRVTTGLAISPAILVLILMLMISLVTGHPQDLFFTRSTRGILVRTVIVTLTLVAPIGILPSVLALAANLAKSEKFFGQLVKATTPNREFSKSIAWILRPLQGIGLSIVFGERFLSFLELSVGDSYARLLVRLTLFMMSGAPVSLFLSAVWALDDLGVRIYNKKTGEVRTTGNSVGTVLPLIAGAIGVSGLFQHSSPLDALRDLLQIVMVLYPPYVLFAICHGEFIRRRTGVLSGKLLLRRIETNVSS